MPIWKTTLKIYSQRKKERKKRKKEKNPFNGRELHMYRPPWLVHETVLYSISSVLHHKQNQQHNKWNILSPVTVWKRYIWYYCLYNSDWKTMQLIHICYITIHNTSNY